MFVRVSIKMEDIANDMDLYRVTELIDPHIGDVLTDSFNADEDWVDDALADLSDKDYAKLFYALANRFENGE